MIKRTIYISSNDLSFVIINNFGKPKTYYGIFQSVIWVGMAKVVPYHVDAVETKKPAIMLTGAVLVDAHLAGVEFTVMKVSVELMPTVNRRLHD